MSFNLGSAHGEIVIDYNGAGVQQAMGDLSNLQQTGTNLMRAGAGVAGFGAAIGGALLGATNQAADFQFQMDAVSAALGGLDASGMEEVTQQALEMGAATKFSAGEVAGVQEALARSGLNAQQLTGGATQAVLDLSAATGESLVPAANAAAAAINLFGLDASQSADVADIFTAGLNNSSATLADFQRGVVTLGSSMSNLNQYANDSEGAFRDTAAAVAYMNAQGLKAADAGVSLARGLENLSTPTSKAAQRMTDLGIAAFDAQGNFIGFPQLFDELNTALAGSSDQFREETLSMLFGAEAADVMNKAVKAGGDPLREYQKLLEANGQAAEQAAIRQDNLRGALEQLTGSISTAAINIGNTFLAPLQTIVEGITSLINAFNSLPPEIQATIAQFAALAAAMSLLGGGALIAAGAILRFGPMFAAAAAAAAPFLAILLAIGAAIGIGILAYKSDFLGFGRAIDKTLGNAQKTIKTFGAVFEDAFAEDKAAGLNDIAAGIAAFGTALQAATGLDFIDQFRAASDAVQAFGDAWATAQNFGFSPAAAALLSLSAALRTLGLEGVASRVSDLGGAVRVFGDEFSRASTIMQQAGFSDVASAVAAVGFALDAAFGTDLAPFFDRAAQAIQVFGTSFQTALADGLNPFSAALIALRDTLTELTGVNLAPVFDQLGESLQSATEGVQTFIQTLLSGDITGALDQIGSAFSAALSGLGDQLGQLASTIGATLAGLVVDLTDWVLNVAAPTLQGWIETAGAWLGEHIRAAVSAASGALAELSNWVLTVAAPTLAGWVNAAAGWLSSTITGVVNSLSGIDVAFSNWTLTIDAPDAGGITIDGSGVASAIGDALNGVLSSIDVSALLDIATFSSKVGAAFRAVYEAALDAIVAAITVLTSADVIEATNNALLGIGAAITAAVVGFAAGFVLGGEVDFSALANSLRDKLTTALNSVFGETAQAGLGGTGVTNTLVQNLSDQIFEMFNTAATDIAARVATIDWTAIPKAVAQGIGDALANFGGALFGASEVQAAEGGETFDAAAFGTQFGDQLAASFESPEFIDAVTASVEAMPAETFSAIGTGILTKIQESITTAMQAAGPGAASETGQGTSPLGADMGLAIVTSIAGGLQTAIDDAPIETFAAIGTSLVTKIQGAISAAMTTADTGGQQGPVGEGAVGGMGASLVSGLATSIAASITAAPIEAFAAIGTALQTKISEVLATAMQAGAGKGTPQAGLGGTGGGGGIGQAIAQSIADAVSGADFSAVAAALQTAGQEAMQGFADGMTAGAAAITTAAQSIITTISGLFQAARGATFTAGAGAGQGFAEGLTSASGAISAAVQGLITTMTGLMEAARGAAFTAGASTGTGFADGIASASGAVSGAVQALVTTATGLFEGAAGAAFSAGAAVGQGFADGIASAAGAVAEAAGALADAAADALAAAAQIASPSKVSMALGEQFGQGFQLGIAGAAPNAAKSSYDMGFESIHALADSLRSNAETTRSRVRSLGDHIRENQGLASGGGQPTTIETTGTVELDGEQMGTFSVETVLGGLIGAQRKGGKRRGRMQ